MAKQIKQIRWFGDGDKRNYPSTVNVQDLLDKNYFEQFSPILQLSIHTLPGVKVYFNDQTDNPIYVGHSGVYQLDLQDTSAVLWGMHFDSEDLDDIEGESGWFELHRNNQLILNSHHPSAPAYSGQRIINAVREWQGYDDEDEDDDDDE